MRYTKDDEPREKSLRQLLETDSLNLEAELIYRSLDLEEIKNDPILEEKFEKAKNIEKNAWECNIKGNDEKSKSKSIKGKPKKNNQKSNRSAMEKI